MASSGGYVVKVSGKRGASGPVETLYVDLGYLILAADGERQLELVLEGGERVLLEGADAAWVREILVAIEQPRKGERGSTSFGGRR